MRVVRCFVAFALLLAGGSWAQGLGSSLTIPTAVSAGPSRAIVVPAPLSDFQRLIHQRSNVNGPNGSVLMRDLLAKPLGPGAREPLLMVERVAPWEKVAKAAARASPYVAAGTLLWEVWDQAGCRVQGGQIQCATDAEPEAGPNGYTRGGSTFYSTLTAAHDAVVAAVQAAGPGYPIQRTCSKGPMTYEPDPLPRWMAGWVCVDTSATNPSYIANYQGKNPIRAVGDVAYCPDGNPIPNGTLVCDGQGVYIPATELEVENRIRTKSGQGSRAGVAGELTARGVPIELDEGQTRVEVPTTIHIDRETTTWPDGQKDIVDRWTDFYPDPEMGPVPGYRWEPRSETNTYPPGVTPPAPGGTQPPGTVPGGTTTGGGSTSTEVYGCGLPNTPPCRIDEGGTPPPPPPPTDEVNDGRAGWLAAIASIADIPAPAWSWSFQLPTACGPITLGETFARFGMPVVDICPFQDKFHDLMGAFWLLATVAGCMVMVGGTLRSS